MKNKFLTLSIALFSVIAMISLVSADVGCFGGMMSGTYGWGMGIFGWIFGVLVLVALVLLIVWLIKQIEKKK